MNNKWLCFRFLFGRSPDFRARASSNASSTGGRLSPIFSEQLGAPDYGLDSVAEQDQANSLAGTLAQTVRLSQPLQAPLESYRDVFLHDSRPPPPPYSSCLSLQSCPIHGYQGCSCFSLNQQQLDNVYVKQVRRLIITYDWPTRIRARPIRLSARKAFIFAILHYRLISPKISRPHNMNRVAK